jgi:alginate O-acetyltransferase complex protein AlgJ
MLRRYRRYFAIVAFILLAAPLIVGIVRPDNPDLILREGRRLTPAPAAPTTFEDWLSLPKEVDAYLKDRFGLREKMIRLHKDLTKPIIPEGNPIVLIARNGHMFLKLENMLQQSAGLILRDKSVSETADTLAAVRDALARRGIKFLVAVPPNASTIYPDDLPVWARSGGRKTEYDLLLEDLAARGVKTLDLRPLMTAAQSQGPAYYLHDTHWTPRGALVAFNAIAEADMHPDWRLDAGSVLGPMGPRPGGDLASQLGIQDDVTERTEPFILPLEGKTELLAEKGTMPDRIVTSGKDGPTIMILGDSFTTAYYPQMLLQHAGRVIWLHHRSCRFAWKWIDKYHPDEVWWMPTERSLNCDSGVRPIDFDE